MAVTGDSDPFQQTSDTTWVALAIAHPYMIQIVDTHLDGDHHRSGQLWIEMRRECGQHIAGPFLWTLARAITNLAKGPVTPNPAIPTDVGVCEFINAAVSAMNGKGFTNSGRGLRGSRLLQEPWLGSDDAMFAAFGNRVLAHGAPWPDRIRVVVAGENPLESGAHSGADNGGLVAQPGVDPGTPGL